VYPINREETKFDILLLDMLKDDAKQLRNKLEALAGPLKDIIPKEMMGFYSSYL